MISQVYIPGRFALQILFRKLLGLMGIGVSKRVPNSAQLEAISKYLTTSHSDRSWWKDSSPQIAKAVFLAIDPKYRRCGIGYELNRYRDKVLVERGVNRYDGFVEMHRIPQIHLLHKPRSTVHGLHGLLFELILIFSITIFSKILFLKMLAGALRYYIHSCID